MSAFGVGYGGVRCHLAHRGFWRTDGKGLFVRGERCLG